MNMNIIVHPALTTLLALMLAHLLADFPLQSNWIALNKGKGIWARLVHVAIHYAAAWCCLLLFANVSFVSWFNQLVIVGYLLVHFVIDTGKGLITARWKSYDNTTLFVIDQFLHLLTVTATTLILVRLHVAWVFSWWPTMAAKTRFHLLVAITIYAGVMFAGGHLIRYFTKGLSSNLDGATGTETSEQLKNAGMYIGWIERFLIITAIAAQSPAMVGLILTGKSIARFPELKDARFAEYFLIGTLLSVLIAVAGGIVLARMLYGTFSLK
jgi:hypothetical protein